MVTLKSVKVNMYWFPFLFLIFFFFKSWTAEGTTSSHFTVMKLYYIWECDGIKHWNSLKSTKIISIMMRIWSSRSSSKALSIHTCTKPWQSGYLVSTNQKTAIRQHSHKFYSKFIMHAHTHTHIRTHTCTSAWTHTHTHACTHAQVYVHAHTHTHTYTHTHTHTHTHTNTHTQKMREKVANCHFTAWQIRAQTRRPR